MQNSKYDIRLKSVALSNFRGFSNLDIDLDDKLTVFIAENGGGKTSILDAVAECLKIYLFKLFEKPYLSLPSVDTFDIKTGTNTMHISLKTEVKSISKYTITTVNEETDGYEPTIISDFSLDIQQAKNKEARERSFYFNELPMDFINSFIEDFQNSFSNDENLPIIVYYGTKTIDINKNYDAELLKEDRLYHLYKGSLDSKRFSFNSFYRWFDTLYKAAILSHQEENTKKESILNSDFLEKEINALLQDYINNLARDTGDFTRNDFVKSFIQKLVPQKDDENISIKHLKLLQFVIEFVMNDEGEQIFKNLRMDYTLEGDRMVIDKKNAAGVYDTLDIYQLSTGEKMIFSLAGDIIHRLILANPKPEELEIIKGFEEFPQLGGRGVVLIDEIDLHLHPKWQRQILLKLNKVFPNVQFVITTHSRDILMGIHSKHILEVSESQIYGVYETYGQDVNYITEVIMQIDSSIFSAEFKKIFNFISDENKEEALKLFKELSAKLPQQTPELVKVMHALNRRNWL